MPTTWVFAVALLARTARCVVGGGLTAPYGYDPAVYYAAAAGLVNGRVPYRDFTLVHPPGIAVLEAPFAFLGRLTTDLTGYSAASVAIIVLASLNAVLVIRVARAMGLSERAAITGGLVYAVWTNAVAFEFVGYLEPVGNFFLLCGLLAFHRALQAETPRASRLWFLCGVALGAAVCIKLWWLVPIAAFLGWQLAAERHWAPTLRIALGAGAALVVVDLPFLLLSGHEMWDSIVLDQLARTRYRPDGLEVLGYLVVGDRSYDVSTSTLRATVVLGAALLAVLLWRAWRIRAARPLVLVLLVQLLQVWFQPVWFPFYTDFVSVALCLVVAAALAQRPTRSWLPAVAVVLVAVSTSLEVAGTEAEPVFPRKELTAAVADVRCLMTDGPMAQIQLNTLSRSFQNRCPDWMDPIGRRLRHRRLFPVAEPGSEAAWSRLYTAYLTSGDAVILTRPPEEMGLAPDFLAQLERGGVIAREGRYTVYRVGGR